MEALSNARINRLAFFSNRRRNHCLANARPLGWQDVTLCRKLNAIKPPYPRFNHIGSLALLLFARSSMHEPLAQLSSLRLILVARTF